MGGELVDNELTFLSRLASCVYLISMRKMCAETQKRANRKYEVRNGRENHIQMKNVKREINEDCGACKRAKKKQGQSIN